VVVRDPCACGSIARPSDMPGAARFRFEKGVHDTQLVSEVNVQQTFALSVPSG